MGEASLPRVRAGVITIPAAHRQGVTRVIVRLSQPPLAAWRSNGRLAFAARSQRLDTHSTSSRAYLSQLARRQAVVAAQVRAAIPQARMAVSSLCEERVLTVKAVARSNAIGIT